MHMRQWQQLNEVRQLLGQQIAAGEQEMAGFLVKTPYVLLLSATGINVVSGTVGGRSRTDRALRNGPSDQRPRGVVPVALPERRGRSRRRLARSPVQPQTARCRDAGGRQLDQVPSVLSRFVGTQDAAESRSA